MHSKSQAVFRGLIVACAALLVAGSATRAATIVGVDADPNGNTAAALGAIEACHDVEPGDTFAVDVYIQDVAGLASFETVLEYNGSILRLTAVDVLQLLALLPASTVSDLSDPTPDVDGSFRAAATDTNGPHESGSGVLVRVTFEALAMGVSLIQPTAIELKNGGGAPIGDTTGDDVFDGDRFSAEIAVGGLCPATAPHALLVAFVPGTPVPTREAIIESLGTRITAYHEEIDAYSLEIIDGKGIGETVELFLAQPEVEMAEAVVLFEPDSHQTYPDDPALQDSEHWYHTNVGQRIAPDRFTPGGTTQQGLIDADTDGPQAWDLNTNCRRLGADTAPAIPFRIGIIDDGVDVNHPDLAANLNGLWSGLFRGGAEVSGGSVQHTPGDGHGTWVASTIAAVGNNGQDASGVCWNADLVIVNLADGRSDSFVAACNHLATVPKLKIVSMSMSGVFGGFSRRALATLRDRGILFVTSAGNNGSNVDGSAGGECIYRDLVNAGMNRVDAGDVRVTGCVVNGIALPAGTVLAGDGDLNSDLVAFQATEKFVDGGGGQYDEGETIVRDMDNSGAISGGDHRYTPSSGGGNQYPAWPDADEDWSGPGTCSDGLDNGGDGATDLADTHCRVRVFHSDVGNALTGFPADHKHIDGDGDGLIAPVNSKRGTPGAYMAARNEDGAGPNTCGDGADNGGDGDRDARDSDCFLPESARFPCVYDLDNIVCVAASDNQDRPGSNREFDSTRSEDGAAGASCIDGEDNGGGDGADFWDADCYRVSVFSNFGAGSVDLAAPGADMMLLCNRDPQIVDNDGDGRTDTCDQDSFGSDADGDGISDGPKDPDGAGAEANSVCVNGFDDDDDGRINDGCPAAGAAEAGAQCTNNFDDDADNEVNDGCALLGVSETVTNACRDVIDNDADGRVNDGCPASGAAEAGAQCINLVDNDADGLVNDGCPRVGARSESLSDVCTGANEDFDGLSNDGCPAVGAAEGAAQCQRGDRLDQDGDGYVNDGCAAINVGAGPDNCPTIPNAGQGDGDGDLRGDACDPEPGQANMVNMARVSIVDGTSFSTPYVAGMAAQCWSLMPDRSYSEIKNLMLREVDRKNSVFVDGAPRPSFGGLVKTGGRLRQFCSSDFTDEPNSYETVHEEPLLYCNQPPSTSGPVHQDYGNEWFGGDVSGEHNANTDQWLDQDGVPNIYLPNGADPVPPCVPKLGPVNLDRFDDGNFNYFPPPPWVPGQQVLVSFDVCSDFFGTADASSAPGTPIGRYSKPAAVGGAVQSDSLIYVNAFFDWNANGGYDLPAEYTVSTIIDPTGAVAGARNLTDFAAGSSAPETPPPTQCTSVLAGFVAQAPFPLWMRWRLDYGEAVGLNDPQPLFSRDSIQGVEPGATAAAPVSFHLDIAEFGETEDRPMRSLKVIKLNTLTFQPMSGWQMTLFSGPNCAGVPVVSSLTDSQGRAVFHGIVEGSYSVAETPQAGFTNTTPLCQNVDLNGTTVASTPVSETFPPAGTDFLNSGARIDFMVFGMPDSVTLQGPVEIVRGNPGDSNFNGRLDITTEIVAMELTGVSDTFGLPVTVRDNPTPSLPSVGIVEEQNPGTHFPAISTFNVFHHVEVQLNDDFVVSLHNEQPVLMSATISTLPPIQTPYYSPPAQSVALVDGNGVESGTIQHALHIPLLGEEGFKVFSNTPQVPPASPPGVPALVVAKDANSLILSWDPSCPAVDRALVFGRDFMFPSTPTGTYGLLGSVCSVTAPFSWNTSPPVPPNRFVWFLTIADDNAGVEGTWGRDSSGIERKGPGPGGSSGQCGTAKNLANPCGQ